VVKAHPGALREAGATANFLLETDAQVVQARRGTAVELSIPMLLPRWLPYRTWPREGMTFIAPAGQLLYHPQRGASWADAPPKESTR
jgi:hypothetical protein